MTPPSHVLAFDVNETLLDLSPLDARFERHLGDGALRAQWFAQMLQLSFVGAITDQYVDFTTAQHAALVLVAGRAGVELPEAAPRTSSAACASFRRTRRSRARSTRLRDAGFTLATLTNSPLDVARAQLDYAGLSDRFDAILSADQVRALKPRREPYELVARTFDVERSGVRLIAAHAWDIAGALAAGCAAAFVARPGMALSPIGARPDIVGADIDDVATRIIAAA